MHQRMERLGAAELDLVLQLLRAGSLTRAAQAMNVEQSTLSRRLSELEKTLGTPLFARSRAGLHPTQAAQRLRPHAERIEQAVIEARRSALGDQAGAQGLVRVAVPDAIADLLVAPMLPALLSDNPQLTVEVLAAPSLVALGRLEADVALRFTKTPTGDVITKKVAASRYAVFGHPRFLAATPRAVGELPWLTWSAAGSREARWVAEHGMAEPRLRVNRATTMIAAAQAGVGVMLLAQVFGRRVKELVEIPTDKVPDFELPVYLASPAAMRDQPAVDVVWQWLAALVGTLQAALEESPEHGAEASGEASTAKATTAGRRGRPAVTSGQSGSRRNRKGRR